MRFKCCSSRLISALLHVADALALVLSFDSDNALPLPMGHIGTDVVPRDANEAPSSEVGQEVLLDAPLDDGQTPLAVDFEVVDDGLRRPR